MAVPSVNFGAEVQTLKGNNFRDNTYEGPLGKAVSEAAHLKNEARKDISVESTETPTLEAPLDASGDQAIIEANFPGDVSLSSASEPMLLTVTSVIANVNESIYAANEAMGPNAIEAAQQELDVSPQGTADRIVSLTTNMYAAYQAANPELTGEDLVNSFVDTISEGVNTGIDEARTILGGLNALEGDIATNIDETQSLASQGLEEFRQSMLDALSTESTAQDTGVDTTFENI